MDFRKDSCTSCTIMQHLLHRIMLVDLGGENCLSSVRFLSPFLFRYMLSAILNNNS